MGDEDSKDFKFDVDDEYADALYREELKDQRVEKLNQRVTIITILIPCLIGVILFIAYRDLTGRVSKSAYTESKEFQDFSAQVQEKLNTLSAQTADLQTSLTAKVSELEKTTVKLDGEFKILKDNFSKTEKALKNIADLKVNKKDQESALAKINDSLASFRKEFDALVPVRNELNAVTSQLQGLDKGLREKLNSLAAQVDKNNTELSQFQSDLSALADQKADREFLDLEILKAKKNYQYDLDQEAIKIEKKLSAISKRIKQLENGLKQLAETPAAALPAKPPNQLLPPTAPKSGGISEQEIKE
jgi:chromosome segregation ATPase